MELKRSLIKFFSEVWADYFSGYVFVAVKDKGRWKEFPIKISRQTARNAEKILSEYPDADWYYCPNNFSGKERLEKDAMNSRWVHGDFDGVDPRICDPQPSIIVRTSYGNYQPLWKLPTMTRPEKVQDITRGLTYHYKADKGGWSITKMLRVPHTENHKYDPPQAVKLIRSKWDETATLKPLDTDEKVEELRKLDGQRVIKKYRARITGEARDALLARRPVRGHRSEVIHLLLNTFLEVGATGEEAVSAVRSTVWGEKFNKRRNADAQWLRELKKCSSKQRHKEEKMAEEVGERVQDALDNVITLSTVDPEQVRWLWYPYFPIGQMSVVEGDPGTSKSTLMTDIIARVTTGRPMPGSRTRRKPGDVIYLSAEDHIKQVIVPRCMSHNAELSRIHVPSQSLFLGDGGIDELQAMIERFKPSLIVCDPIQSFMGIDINKANQVREVLDPLGKLLEAHDVTFIGVRHLRKSGGDAIYAGAGAVDIIGRFRTGLVVTPDKDDPDYVRALIQFKSNVGPIGRTRLYCLKEGVMKTRKINWIGKAEYGHRDLETVRKDAKDANNTAAKEVEDFLRNVLESGPIRSVSVISEAETRHGFSPELVKRVKARMPIKSIKRGKEWLWQIQS